MAFNTNFNKDNVLYRNITVGLLDLLNRKIQIPQQIDNDTVTYVAIPFLYNNSGDSRFLQDFFIPLKDDCDNTYPFAEGNSDPIPRGVITFSNMIINSSALTNRFVRGTYNKEVKEDEKTVIKAYSAYLNSIPLTITFECQIIVDSLLDSFKIIQELIATFYKVQQFSVDYRGVRVQNRVGFPEEYGIEKTIDFSYQEEGRIFVKFSLELESYQPVFDGNYLGGGISDRFRGNVMDHGIGNVVTTVPGLGKFADLEVDLDPSMSKPKIDQDNDGDEKPPIL